jgi:hypothetical protein
MSEKRYTLVVRYEGEPVGRMLDSVALIQSTLSAVASATADDDGVTILGVEVREERKDG